MHYYGEKNGSSYDFVIGMAIACVEAVQDSWEAPRKDVWSQNTTILVAALFDRNGKFLRNLNHLGKESIGQFLSQNLGYFKNASKVPFLSLKMPTQLAILKKAKFWTQF